MISPTSMSEPMTADLGALGRQPAAHDARRNWELAAFAVLFALTMPAVKVHAGIDIRIGQLALAGVFALALIRDLHRQTVAWGPLLAVTGLGLLLSGMSVLSTYPKVKEMTFLVKYVVVFPTAFYLGLRLLTLAGAERLIRVIEVTLAAACLLSLFLHMHPVPLLVHERPAYLSDGLKGPFWEQGELAFSVGLFLVASLALRLEYGLRPRRAWLHGLLYGLALGCALASYNKTIWIALIGACMAAAVLYRGGNRFGDVARVWAKRLAVIAVVGGVLLAAYNAWLPGDEKLVTQQMLENKWQNERGAALRLTWDLIGDAPVLGHGFGFVEAYFGTYPTDIIGLGSGVAQIFNSYLDLWLSEGLVGFVYALGLLAAVLSTRSLVSVMVVAYLFVFANFNPVAQHEYYHLFLGLALGAAAAVRTGRCGG